jgi:uncharacterized protein YggE
MTPSSLNPTQNKSLMIVSVIVLVALFGFLAAKTRNELAVYRTIGRPTDVRDTFTIEGEGKVSGTPNLAEISFGLLSEGVDVAKIQKENTQKVNAMVAAIKALGVADKDIQTSQYSINPKYDYTNGTTKLNGYTISQNLSVKLRDLSKIGDALTKIGQLGGNQVNGPTFTIDDPSSLKQEARMKALEDARKKAEALSGVLGVKVGRVVTFSESAYNQPPVPMMYRSEGAMATDAVAPAAPSIEAGSLDVKSNVSVTFEAL